jgi:hypothetical protein
MRAWRWGVVLVVVGVIAGLLPSMASAVGGPGSWTGVSFASTGTAAPVAWLPCGEQIDSQATPRLSGFACTGWHRGQRSMTLLLWDAFNWRVRSWLYGEDGPLAGNAFECVCAPFAELET